MVEKYKLWILYNSYKKPMEFNSKLISICFLLLLFCLFIFSQYEFQLLPVSNSFLLYLTLHRLLPNSASLRFGHVYDILHGISELTLLLSEFESLLTANFCPLFLPSLLWLHNPASHHFGHAYGTL